MWLRNFFKKASNSIVSLGNMLLDEGRIDIKKPLDLKVENGTTWLAVNIPQLASRLMVTREGGIVMLDVYLDKRDIPVASIRLGEL